ncbi:cellular nucleic acid-binding protein-like [Stegodyphus dumicola]|uniref:cellular nucleic acid-binding protein-like n=1 Tax=Stegodyphus dumicola TaxID=202533 RepID=UPI0015ADBC97|nr:cellular nucleic acid-binding protein-like [Stegodyphus dumicola]
MDIIGFSHLTPQLFKSIMQSQKVNIGWTRKNIREYIRVIQCKNCLEFGHTKRSCTREQRCFKCGKRGHLNKECNFPQEKCVNCKHANKHYHLNLDINHSSVSKNSASKQREMDR